MREGSDDPCRVVRYKLGRSTALADGLDDRTRDDVAGDCAGEENECHDDFPKEEIAALMSRPKHGSNGMVLRTHRFKRWSCGVANESIARTGRRTSRSSKFQQFRFLRLDTNSLSYAAKASVRKGVSREAAFRSITGKRARGSC